jgi:hypothetical protein
LCDVEFATLFRLVVVTNVISKTVVEMTNADIGINW